MRKINEHKYHSGTEFFPEEQKISKESNLRNSIPLTLDTSKIRWEDSNVFRNNPLQMDTQQKGLWDNQKIPYLYIS